MLKKILLISLCVVGFVAVAMAKDGPFPLRESVGVWRVGDNSGRVIDISTGKFYSRSQRMETIITIKDAKGNIIASGRAHHPMGDVSLVVYMVDYQGYRFQLVASAIYDNVGDPKQPGRFHLVLEAKHRQSALTERTVIEK